MIPERDGYSFPVWLQFQHLNWCENGVRTVWERCQPHFSSSCSSPIWLLSCSFLHMTETLLRRHFIRRRRRSIAFCRRGRSQMRKGSVWWRAKAGKSIAEIRFEQSFHRPLATWPMLWNRKYSTLLLMFWEPKYVLYTVWFVNVRLLLRRLVAGCQLMGRPEQAQHTKTCMASNTFVRILCWHKCPCAIYHRQFFASYSRVHAVV